MEGGGGRRRKERSMEKEGDRDRGREGRREKVEGNVRVKATGEEAILF